MNAKPAVVILSPLLALSIGLNVLQGERLVELRQAAADASHDLQVGARAPELRVRDLTGRELTLSLGARSSRPKVLYVFSPSCGWCRHDVEAINSLLPQISGKYDFAGLSLSGQGLHEFVARYHGAFPIYRDISPETASAYGFTSTPETIVVSPEGTVLALWRGAYVEATKLQVERFFSVKLPDARS